MVWGFHGYLRTPNIQVGKSYSQTGIGVPLGTDSPAPGGPGEFGQCPSTNPGEYFRTNRSVKRGPHKMQTRPTKLASRFVAILTLVFAIPLAIGIAPPAATDAAPIKALVPDF